MWKALVICWLPAWAAGAAERPPIEDQVTFLYYDDLEAAARFYSEVLGLEKSFELEWVKIFRLTDTASVGLVNATKGSHRPSSTEADKPVMVSIVVAKDDVEAWHAYLKGKGVDVGEGPQVGADGSVKAFGFRDPGGYTLEIFAWLE